MKEQTSQRLMIALLALGCVWLFSTALELYSLSYKHGKELAASMLLLGGLGIFFLGGRVLLWVSEKRLARDKQEQQEAQLALLRQMSAVMAHELRNPLASAKGNSQLLAEMLGQGTRPQSKAEQVVRELIRVEDLTNELLEFIRAGEAHRQECDPAALLRELADTHQLTLQLSSEQAPTQWPLDARAIERALLSVLRNAAQAQEELDAPIEVVVKQADEALYISVRDHGPGLSPSIDAFSPFVTTKVSGVGLGLALSRQIILAHHGQITLKNHPEGGAIAELCIPRGSAQR